MQLQRQHNQTQQKDVCKPQQRVQTRPDKAGQGSKQLWGSLAPECKLKIEQQTPEPMKHVAKQSSWLRIPLGALSGLVCVPIKCVQCLICESSLSRHLHTRIAAGVRETSDRAVWQKNDQHRSQRSTLRNSLPGVGFRWGHCQVLFVSQCNVCKQPSANPVSHDTCTRELPPEFVTQAAKLAKNEQRRSQHSTLRNSLPGV